MWQVLWLSPSPEQAKPYAEASERKLRSVSFLEPAPGQGRKSKNSNVNNFLSSCFTGICTSKHTQNLLFA